MKISNVTVSTMYSDGGGPFALRGEIGPDVYHVWLDRETKQPLGDTTGSTNDCPIIYKNPASGARPHDPGYYRTRTLKAGTKFGQALIAAMMEEAVRRDLFTAAVRKREQECEAERQKNAEAARVRQIKEMGPELLDALKLLQKAVRDAHLLDIRKRFELCVADAAANTAIARAERLL